MVDHLYRDASGFGFVEGAGSVAVEGCPGVCVDFGLEGRLEGFVGIVGAEEVGVTDEESFLVVIRIDEPAGDAVGTVGANFSGIWMEDVYSVDFYPESDRLSASRISISGSPKITNRFPLPVFLSSSAMCRSAFMRALSTGNAAQFFELR